MGRPVVFLLFYCLACACLPSPVHALSLTTQPVASGIPAPIFVTHAPFDSTRLFIVEKQGRVRIVKNDSLLPTPFLDIIPRVLSSGGEQGLLGLAFHPAYQTNGFFFLYYTARNDGRTVVSRFRVTANPDIADTAVEKLVLTVPQPASNHNGGMIAFGPDNYLYVGLGDGGFGGDPANRAQDPDDLLGKMLRLDVDTTAAGGYAIPATNPWYGQVSPRPEIWALGLRNPWRWSFDRLTGDIHIADVGQGQWEEINWTPSSGAGGLNYGWRLKEGDHCYSPVTGCDTIVGLIDPIWEYSHDSGRCSVTGGFIYRGCAIPDLQGAYLFGDYCTGEIWALTHTAGGAIDVTNLNSQIGRGPGQLVSFGEDYFGEVYVCNMGAGTVDKIIPTGPAFTCSPCCAGTVGNVDNSPDQSVDISDLTRLLQYLFIDGSPICSAEANCDLSPDGNVDIVDLTRLIDYLFLSTSPLGNCL